MDHTEEDWKVTVGYNAGYIVLSYFVSLTGAATTLELLHRRTSRKGLSNWYLLITAAICMGGIGIWCMHYIGNLAIELGKAKNGQIVYDSRCTAASFFLPIFVLLSAFYLLGVVEAAGSAYIITSGTLGGAAIVGMHYLGQLGIANYNCSYDKAFVIAAAIIAVVATNVALFVFFRMRANWSNGWWKRVLCAMVLAGAVSGMHWVATIGTHYRHRESYSQPTVRLSRTQTVIICTALSFGSCIILLTFTILTNRTHKKSRERAQQLVLACAYFDDAGRLMVTTDGQLPNTKITDSYEERSHEDVFGRTHPAFLWVFRATRNWRTIKDIIPGMKDHLALNAGTKDLLRGPSKQVILEDDNSDSISLDSDFLLLFKEMFCVSANNLAVQTHQPLEKLGVLYEEPLETGTLTNNRFGILSRRNKKTNSYNDLEASDNTVYFGRGHFLFVVRNLNKQDCDRFAASGYRFADVQQIVDVQSKSMQVDANQLSATLNSMQDYSSTENLMTRGVHIAAFVLRPTMRKGFDVLVPKEQSNQLPLSTLPIQDLNARQCEILKDIDGLTVNQVMKWLNSGHCYTMPKDLEFCQQLGQAFSGLVTTIHDSAFNEAVFSARKITAPSRPVPGSNMLGRCTILAVRAMTNLHSSSPNTHLVYKPLRLFNAQQQVYAGLADHAAFARQFHREFFHVAERRDAKSMVTSRSFRSFQHTPRQLLSHWPKRNNNIALPSPIAEKSLISNASAFGGIMVSNQVCVEVGDATETDKNSTVPILQLDEIRTVESMGTTGGARFDEESGDSRTYVDEIYGMFKKGGILPQEHI